VTDQSAREAVAPGAGGSYSRLSLPSLSTVMPYIYVAVLAIAILAIEPALIDGPDAIDVRFSAVFPLAIVAFAQTLNLFTRGIDLSIGGTISVTTSILAVSGSVKGADAYLELLGMIGLGIFIGTVNGLVIAYSGLQPFLVTLATWTIWDGIALAVLPIEGGSVPGPATSLILGPIAGVPKSVLCTGALFVLWAWLRHSRFVRDLRAMGSDAERARLIGVRMFTRTVQCYAFSGACAAIAGIWIAVQEASGSPTAGDEYILTSIAAVVIGGASIFGGTGSAAASMVGAVAYLMIPDLIAATNISSFWSVFLQGFLLIVAVTLSALAIRVRDRKLA
jgi:ribose transport system permease protein